MFPIATYAPDFAQVIYLSLAPLLLPLLLLLARGDGRRAIVTLSIGGLACLLLGVVLNGASVGFQFRDAGPEGKALLSGDASFISVFLAEALVPVGVLLSLAALFFALQHAAHTRRWAWLAALAITVPVLSLADPALLSKALIVQINPSLAYHIMFGPMLEHDSTPAAIYFLTVIFLLVLAPLPALLYGMRHRSDGRVPVASAPLTAPVPPVADIK